MRSGKHQRSRQRCQDLCWKVYDRAQSFVLRSYTMHESRNQNVFINLVPRAHVSFSQRLTKRHVGSGNEIAFLLVSSSVSSNQQLCFVHSQGQKKRTNAHNKELCRVSYNHFLLLTMVHNMSKGLSAGLKDSYISAS